MSCDEQEKTNIHDILYENSLFLVRRLAGSSKKSSVKAIARIFEEFTGVINPFVMLNGHLKIF